MCVYSKLVNYLEFSKILNQLSNFAIYRETKNLILKIEPSHNLNIVQNKIDEVDEAMSFLQLSEYFEFFKIEKFLL